MGWLDFHEQVIDEQAVTWVEQGQVLAEAKHGKEIQGFFGFDGMGVAKDAIGAAEVIAQTRAALATTEAGLIFIAALAPEPPEPSAGAFVRPTGTAHAFVQHAFAHARKRECLNSFS